MYEGKAKKTRAGCDSARATTRRERGIGSPTRSNGITLVFGGASLIKSILKNSILGAGDHRRCSLRV